MMYADSTSILYTVYFAYCGKINALRFATTLEIINLSYQQTKAKTWAWTCQGVYTARTAASTCSHSSLGATICSKFLEFHECCHLLNQ